MPAFAAWLIGAFFSVLATEVGKLLISFAIGIVAYTGIKATATFVKDYALSSLGSMPNEIVSLMAYMKVGVCINIIFSAMLVRMLINGLQSDTVKRFVMK